ncbi:MAG: exodeoxyribonuclease VII small subunit [Sulfuricurvum sp.]
MSDNELDFEQKLEKAREFLSHLQNPELTLEASIAAYESGIKELDEASKMLENAELKISQIKSNR